MILADALGLEILGGVDDFFQRLRDGLGLALIFGAIEIEKLPVPLGIGRERPFGGAPRRDLGERARVGAPAREHFAEREAAVFLGARPLQGLDDAHYRLVLAGRDVIAPQRINAFGAAAFERQLHQRRPLVLEKVVDQRAAQRHAGR